jgi:hypothetical protein
MQNNNGKERILRSLSEHADKNTMKRLDKEVRYVAQSAKDRVDRHKCFDVLVPTQRGRASKAAPRVRVRMDGSGPRKRVLLQKFIFWMKLEESNKRAMYNSRGAVKKTKTCGDKEEFFRRGCNRVNQLCSRKRRMSTGKLCGGKQCAEFDFYCMNPDHIEIRIPDSRQSMRMTVRDDEEQQDVEEEQTAVVDNLTTATVEFFESRRSQEEMDRIFAEDDSDAESDEEDDQWDFDAVGDLFNQEDQRHRSTVLRILVNKNDPSDKIVQSAKVIMVNTARDEGLQIL